MNIDNLNKPADMWTEKYIPIEKKIIHIKVPETFFNGYNYQDNVAILKNLQQKIERHGAEDQFICIATPFDITCMNDEDLITTIEGLFDVAIERLDIRDRVDKMFESIKDKLK